MWWGVVGWGATLRPEVNWGGAAECPCSAGSQLTDAAAAGGVQDVALVAEAGEAAACVGAVPVAAAVVPLLAFIHVWATGRETSRSGWVGGTVEAPRGRGVGGTKAACPPQWRGGEVQLKSSAAAPPQGNWRAKQAPAQDPSGGPAAPTHPRRSRSAAGNPGGRAPRSFPLHQCPLGGGEKRGLARPPQPLALQVQPCPRSPPPPGEVYPTAELAAVKPPPRAQSQRSHPTNKDPTPQKALCPPFPALESPFATPPPCPRASPPPPPWLLHGWQSRIPQARP